MSKIRDRGNLKAHVTLGLVGDDDLREKLLALADDVLQKILKPVGGRAMKAAVDTVRDATPEDENSKKPSDIYLRGGKYVRFRKMKDSVKAGSATPSRRNYGAIGKLWFDTKDPYVAAQALMLEYGTAIRQTKKGAVRGAIKPIGFLKRAMESSRSRVIRTLTEEARKSLNRYVKKMQRQKRSQARALKKKVMEANI